MAADSIFKFADKFGYTSPFGDWLGVNKKSLSITIKEVYHYQDDQKRDKYRVTYTVMATNLADFSATVKLVQEGIIDANLFNYEYPFNEMTLREGTTPWQTDFFKDDVEKHHYRWEGEPTFHLRLTCDGLLVESTKFTISEVKEFVAKEKKPELNCDCGKELATVFKCDERSSGPGPKYRGSKFPETYPNWDNVPGIGKATLYERRIISAVALNEAGFDGVQCIDNQMLSMGIMQKTIHPDGKGGELLQQLYEFREKNDYLYECFLKKCGWVLAEKGMSISYTELDAKSKRNITYEGKHLYKKLREGFKSEDVDKPVPSIMAAPFVRLGLNSAFQDKQVLDSLIKLRKMLKSIPDGYNYKVSDFLNSLFGQAVAYDECVNKPSHVPPYLGRALDNLRDYYKRKGITVSKNPQDWGDNHTEYEKKLIRLWGPRRGEHFVDKKGGLRKGMDRAIPRLNQLVDYLNIDFENDYVL